MRTKTDILHELFLEARTRFSNQIESLTENDLQKKLGDSPNSVGFLIRHIGDIELLFAKNVFGDSSVKVSAKTVMLFLSVLKEHLKLLNKSSVSDTDTYSIISESVNL